jgi:hypothetical protein
MKIAAGLFSDVEVEPCVGKGIFGLVDSLFKGNFGNFAQEGWPMADGEQSDPA